MALSHICGKCGYDLSKIRPTQDPMYRLPLIGCPGCGSWCVRRRHPIATASRRALRLLAAAAALVRNTLLVVAVGFIPLMMIGVAVAVFEDEPITLWDYALSRATGTSEHPESMIALADSGAWLILVMAPLTGLLCGVLAVGGLWWWRAWRAIGLSVLLGPLLLALMITGEFISRLLEQLGAGSEYPFFGAWGAIESDLRAFGKHGGPASVLILAGLAVGWLGGIRVRRSRETRERRRWLRKLAKLRARRRRT